MTVFGRGKRKIENDKGCEHESIFTFKMALECFQTKFFTTSRAENISCKYFKFEKIYSTFRLFRGSYFSGF